MPMYPHFRPDASGLYGGSDRKERPASGNDFPYDRDGRAGKYGSTMAKAVGQSTAGADDVKQPVPKDIEHTVWDDLAEAMGIPFSLSISNRGGRANNFAPGLTGGKGGECACGGSCCSARGGQVDHTPDDSEIAAAGRAGGGDIWETLLRYMEFLARRGGNHEVGDRDDDHEVTDRTGDELPAFKSWRGLNPPEED